jgi:chemotaxis protein methyltransferase CheR
MDTFCKTVMTPEESRLIREYVVEKYGLQIESGREEILSRKLLPRLGQLRLSSFSEYYAYLKFAPQAAGELDTFISLLTNNETYFFREESQLKAFSHEVLPSLKEKKLQSGDRTLHILSAGCSTGEEVYTLAMLVFESGCFAWNWDVCVTGVDVDTDAIATARRGIYSGRAFQSTPGRYLKRYFNQCSEGYQVSEGIRSVTRFMAGNLLNLGSLLPEGGLDIIFCRNVLIYFGDETIKSILDNFTRYLRDDGLLFLGHSESLVRLTDRYLPLRMPGAIIYQCKGQHCHGSR